VLKSTYTVSESGTAGPTGGKPNASGHVARNRTPGYVAVAVAAEGGTATKEAETNLGGQRERNMVAFAVAGLELVRDVILGTAKL